MKSFYCFACLLLVTACGPSDQGAVSNNLASQGQASEVGSPKFRKAVVVLHNLGFATQVDDNNVITKWGTPHRILEEVDFLEEEKELSFNNRKVPYVKIRRSSGQEGWSNKNYVIPDAIPGVIVTEKSIFYLQPDNLSPGNQFVIQGDLVAVLSEAHPNNFVKVAYANPATSRLLSNVFLKSETVSTIHDDVISAVSLFLALREANIVKREELLKTASSTASLNFIQQIVQRELSIIELRFKQEFLTQNNQLEIEEPTVVLDMPTDYGVVLGQIEQGTKVIALRKLILNNNVWFEIEEPKGFIKKD